MTPTHWMRLTLDLSALAMEAQSVIALRSLKLALGDRAAMAESQLMLQEKLVALTALQWRAWQGWLGLSPPLTSQATVGHLRRKVQANRRRLGRSSQLTV